jgi:prepilin-type N-terminal cleavage/methylation domain-containing protein
MTSKGGFTLVEVMAAVLVLGLLYTVLASSAMRGLRSEGVDRRRADAEMIADRELSEIETQLANGVPLEDGLAERDQDAFKVSSDVEPYDVLAMLPAPLPAEIAKSSDPRAPSVLHDERGKTRMRRVSVVVAWDEAGAEDHVERTTFAYNPSALEQYFPSATGEAAGGGQQSEIDKMRAEAPPELLPFFPAPSRPGRSSRMGPSQ